MADSKTRILELEEMIAIQEKEIDNLKAHYVEKERLASEYSKSQQRFRTIFEESSVGKKIINSDLKIIKVNRSVVSMLGYSEEELTGKRIIEFAHPDFAGQWNTLRHELWTANRISFSLDTCMLRKIKVHYGAG